MGENKTEVLPSQLQVFLEAMVILKVLMIDLSENSLIIKANFSSYFLNPLFTFQKDSTQS